MCRGPSPSTVLVEQDAETNLVDKRCHDNDRLPAVTLVFVLLLLFAPAIDYLQQIDLQLKISRVSISLCRKKMDACSCGVKLSKHIFHIGLHMKGSYARSHVHMHAIYISIFLCMSGSRATTLSSVECRSDAVIFLLEHFNAPVSVACVTAESAHTSSAMRLFF